MILMCSSMFVAHLFEDNHQGVIPFKIVVEIFKDHFLATLLIKYFSDIPHHSLNFSRPKHNFLHVPPFHIFQPLTYLFI
jgi:hypothetical protein